MSMGPAKTWTYGLASDHQPSLDSFTYEPSFRGCGTAKYVEQYRKHIRGESAQKCQVLICIRLRYPKARSQ